ncbi:MAG TPA: M14 family metallopeptidase [Symbiobacteriaceae bacterium]|nr:M14 family metallopeptidase [Symbiobacteriaceae bacterium]
MKKITCLTQLYTPMGLLRDGDGDGLPDGFDVRFMIGTNPGAMDVAARLGLESAAFTPGFTDEEARGVPLVFGPDNPICRALEVPEGRGMIALMPGLVVVTGDTYETGWAAARWLAATFPFTAPGGPLLAEQAGGRPVLAVILRDGCVEEIVTGDAPGEAGADKPTLAGNPPAPAFVAQAPGDLPPAGLDRLFTVDGFMGSSDTARHDQAGWQVQVSPDLTPDELAGLCELAARTGVEATGLRFPFAVRNAAPGTQVVLRNGAPAGAAWVSGQLVVNGTPDERAATLRRLAAEAGLVDGLHATLFTRRAGLPAAPAPEGEEIFDLVIEQEWEVERFRRAWANALAAVLPGAPVAVDLRISEPLPVREALAEEMAAALGARGVPEARIRVLSAYKQGFHWLEEEMLPRLQELGPLGRVSVTCARFAGATPGATGDILGHHAGAPAPGGGVLEMPIRWLQELYPADELLARELPGVQVAFDMTDSPQRAIYQLNAFGLDGALLLEEGFSPICSARAYLPEFPERGRVHPPTGLLRVEQGGCVLAETAIDTDAEAFWTAWQEQVLPRLRAFLTPAPDPADQPFFGRLTVEVAMSEDDRRLGIREEQISPLDALHEDLYFYTLDYLNQLGLAQTGKGYPAPGAVEPWVVYAEGGPRARVRLFSLPPIAAATSDALPQTAAELPAPAARGIPQDQVIGPDQLPPYLAYLAALPGVRVWRAGLSLGGRPTWALSVISPTAGAIAPPQKLSAWRPTLVVNARRHANEVSSTNSILRLAELAARAGLAKGINLIISPMENVDGAAVHYAMQQVHPTWKLHAARFNAAGVDFGYDQFEPEPRFGEARTLPTLWRAFLPDVILDDHGYPSHEWVQPFSGYSSAPYFRTSWWMPNALIYGIHRWMDPERFPANAALQEALRGALAERLTADEEIESYTRKLLDRYVTYGQRYVPEKFPLQTHKGFVSLTGNVAAGPEARSYVGRFPHITAAELITEVPDETAQGDYLALCARAHLEGDLAVLSVLQSSPQPVVRRRWSEGETVCWSVGRERPYSVASTFQTVP